MEYNLFNILDDSLSSKEKIIISPVTENVTESVPRRQFPDATSADENWTAVDYKTSKKKKNYDDKKNYKISYDNNRKFSDDKKFSDDRKYDTVPKRNIKFPNNEYIKVQEPTVELSGEEPKKKSFAPVAIAKKHISTINLPEHYKKRNTNNEFEIPQCEYLWIRGIGGLEKSQSNEKMFSGAMACAISYYEKKEYMQTNKFFKITPELQFNDAMQEELIEMICMQTVAILFHRLIKSDSVEIVKTLLKNLPIYRAVTNNPVENTSLSRSIGSSAYNRVRQRFINDFRIIHNKKGTSSQSDINAANARILATEKKWINYILQSVWNGNNPTHDCLYYGAYQCFEYLLEFYFINKMEVELNNMLLVPNIQEESHSDILTNGKKACEQQKSYIIRYGQFVNCEGLYNRTIETLRGISEQENNVLGLGVACAKLPKEQKESVPETTTSDILITEEIESDGDNVNICSLITNGNIDGMVNHIIAHKTNKQLITRTIEIWKDIAKMDKTGQQEEYIEDLLFNHEVKTILDELASEDINEKSTHIDELASEDINEKSTHIDEFIEK